MHISHIFPLLSCGFKKEVKISLDQVLQHYNSLMNVTVKFRRHFHSQKNNRKNITGVAERHLDLDSREFISFYRLITIIKIRPVDMPRPLST